MIRALRHKNYRLFFFGQGVSLIGTWMTRVATSWLIYRMTRSPLLLGVIGFASQVPAFAVTPLAGVLADRINLRRLIIATQVLAALQSATLAFLALKGIISVWHIIALSVLQGLIDGFDMPSRQAFMVQIVDKPEDWSNAIALNSSIFNAARLVGPSIAGMIIAASNEGVCFLADAVSYAAVVAALLAMKIKAHPKPVKHEPFFEGLRSGFKYAMDFIPIRTILIMIALISLMGMPFTVLLPVFADRVLGGGAKTLGFLVGASGFGALSGALFLASRTSVLGLGRMIPRAAIIFSLGLIGFALSNSFWLSLPLVYLAGMGLMMQMASSNTLLQTLVDDDKRGRVMGFYVMAFTGMAPCGSLFAGFLASRFGAPMTLILGGVLCLSAGLLFQSRLPYLRKMIRPVYLKKGIIKETLSGIQTAAQLSSPPEG